MEKTAAGKSLAKGVFILSWICYLNAYLGRYNLISVLPVMIVTGVVDKINGGLMGTALLFSYGMGQLLNGNLGDRIHPRFMITIGMLGSGLCNFAMTFAGGPHLMIALWAANGYFLSMLWGPILRLLAMWFRGRELQNRIVNMQMSMFAGTFCAYVLSALIIKYSRWNFVFAAAGFIEIVSGLLLFGLLSRAQKAPPQENMTVGDEERRPDPGDSLKTFLTVFLPSGMLWITMGSLFCGMLKDGVALWLPTYINEQFGTSSFLAVVSVMVIPVVNLASLYLFTWLNRRLGEDEIKTSVICFIIAGAAFCLLLPAGGRFMLFAVAIFAVASGAMFGANTMLLAILPIRFHRKGCVSSVAGFLDALSYLASAVSAFAIGVVASHFGWNATIFLYVFIALLGGVSLAGIRKRWLRFRKSELL